MSASEALVTCLIDDNGVATLRLNRPEQGNALSLPLVEALSDLVGNLDVDTSVRCILR
jgi:enoyl-CoA hydratase/carnithine racemase